MLNLATDPECTQCGCRQSQVIASGVVWGKPYARRLCSACRHEWETPTDNVRYPVVCCPFCNADGRRTEVTSTRPHGVRYHRCKDCRLSFRSDS